MFLAPFDSFHAEQAPAFVDQLLSAESLRRTGYFEPGAVHHWRRAFRTLRAGSPHRASIEMGLVGVIATQLWHHTYIDGKLADLPSLVAGFPLPAKKVSGPISGNRGDNGTPQPVPEMGPDTFLAVPPGRGD